jgi:3-hydroxyisobutyrate dehydrogenase-like beta-hydroxyacid dehydrogenase
MMMNQASIADIVELAAAPGLDPVRLVSVLKLGSASSTMLSLLNTMVRPDNVDHLAAVGTLDMDLFDTAMTEVGVNVDVVTARARGHQSAAPAGSSRPSAAGTSTHPANPGQPSG